MTSALVDLTTLLIAGLAVAWVAVAIVVVAVVRIAAKADADLEGGADGRVDAPSRRAKLLKAPAALRRAGRFAARS